MVESWDTALDDIVLYSAIAPKSEDKYVIKVFNWSEVHFSEMTCYKIHTLSTERIEAVLYIELEIDTKVKTIRSFNYNGQLVKD